MPTRTRQRFVRWHDDTNRRIGKNILWSRKRSASKQREKMETNDGVCIEMRQQVSRCLSWWAFLWPPFLSLSLSLSQKMEIKIWNMKQQLIGALAGGAAATVITIFKMFKLFWFRLPSRGLLTKSYNQGTSANGITSPFNKTLGSFLENGKNIFNCKTYLLVDVSPPLLRYTDLSLACPNTNSSHSIGNHFILSFTPFPASLFVHLRSFQCNGESIQIDNWLIWTPNLWCHQRLLCQLVYAIHRALL